MLFGNLIPVTTFAIEIARGYRPSGVELFGVGLTLGALVASNLLARRPARAGHEEAPGRRASRSRLARVRQELVAVVFVVDVRPALGPFVERPVPRELECVPVRIGEVDGDVRSVVDQRS